MKTLHVAADLAFTFGEVSRVLEPGARLISSECVWPWPADTLYAEFVFNLLETFRPPRRGFLTPEQWTAAIEAARLADLRILPDIVRIRE